MTEKYSGFDAADYLDSEETITEFLCAAAEDENPDVLLSAIGAVARARGMARVAEDAGLNRESLYKALSPGAHPRHDTIQRVINALGLKIRFQALSPP
ncbi:MAG: putative addiction module antidote protein [Candidatus Accumulibacter sp.]|jgi:probable addiction module antidote protein|nr:putative addiction module antidote protein [Accumulibacter sp.]